MKLLAATDIKNYLFRVPEHTGAENLAASPGSLISSLLPNIIIASGVIFLVIIIISGFQILSRAGSTANAQTMAKHKSTLTMGVIGLLIIISAYFILEIVSRTLGVNFFNAGTFSL